jgi:hypothetical protein
LAQEKDISPQSAALHRGCAHGEKQSYRCLRNTNADVISIQGLSYDFARISYLLFQDIKKPANERAGLIKMGS